MRNFEPWDLVKVPFPYTNRPVLQRRPALIVAAIASPAAPVLLWVLMVTSAGNRPWAGDVPISQAAAVGLPAPSVVRSAKIATIEARHAEILGSLALADRVAVTAALRQRLAPLVRDSAA